jgi:peptidoglycan/LPS O-acetylase OafA/YrhL
MGDRNDRWPFLDLVRFGAALLVMFGHVRGFFFQSITQVENAGAATKAFYLLTGVHREAVVLFFVVSGFLIGGRAWQLIEQGRFDFGRYVLDRFTRIYLVLLPALILIAAISWFGSSFFADTRLFGVRPLEPAGITSGWTWSQVPCHLASLQGVACIPWGLDPPLWSLGYEWVFYFLAPLGLCAFYARFHPLARAAAFIVTLCAAASVISLVTGLRSFGSLFAIWFLGAAAARMVAWKSVPTALGAAGLVLAAGCMIVSRMKSVPLETIDAGIAIGLALALACRPILGFRVPGPLVYRGAAFSFSLYLLHIPVGLLAGAVLETVGFPRELAPPGSVSFAAFVVTAATCLAASYGFARLTEDNTDAVRRWLRSPQPKRAVSDEPIGASARV